MKEKEPKQPGGPKTEKEDGIGRTAEQTAPPVEEYSTHLDDLAARAPRGEDGAFSRDEDKKELPLARESQRVLLALMARLGVKHPQRTYMTIAADAGPDIQDNRQTEYIMRANTAAKIGRRLASIERASPGAVGYLSNERGIRSFHRFTPEFWSRQYEERETDAPYVTIVFPSDLEKEHLTSTSVYTRLQNDLAKLREPHLARVVEVDGLAALHNAIVRLNRAYNGDGHRPIPAVIYDGHGTGDRLFLGETMLGQKEMEHPRFMRAFDDSLKDAFTPHALFVLGSCEASGPTHHNARPIAEVLKERMTELFGSGIRVLASDESVAQFTRLKPILSADGSLEIDISSFPLDLEDGRPAREARYRYL